MDLFPGLNKKDVKELQIDFKEWWAAFDDKSLIEIENEKDKEIQLCSCGSTIEDIVIEELTICTKCGEIIDRPFDTTAEYRYFTNDDRNGDPCRVGAPQDPRLPEASLGTIILSGKGKTMHRIRKHHIWNAMPYKERALLQTFERLALISTNNGVSQSIIEDTKEMFVSLHELCDRRGLTRDAILASCLYIALKQAGVPRKPKEVADMFSLSTATFTKAIKYFQEIFTLAEQKGIKKKSTVKTGYGSTRAEDYISLPISRLPIPRAKAFEIEKVAKDLANLSEKEGYSIENVPPSLAAGCIAYILSKYPEYDISYTDIAKAADVSIATLQKCLRRLEMWDSTIKEKLKV
jgi:transcription initiation factor TFIIIB Brf1 subunit/transcription initiation factor TFIIB